MLHKKDKGIKRLDGETIIQYFSVRSLVLEFPNKKHATPNLNSLISFFIFFIFLVQSNSRSFVKTYY
jgi:hypothetical protein